MKIIIFKYFQFLLFIIGMIIFLEFTRERREDMSKCACHTSCVVDIQIYIIHMSVYSDPTL
jgi:hypothetical protein